MGVALVVQPHRRLRVEGPWVPRTHAQRDRPDVAHSPPGEQCAAKITGSAPEVAAHVIIASPVGAIARPADEGLMPERSFGELNAPSWSRTEPWTTIPAPLLAVHSAVALPWSSRATWGCWHPARRSTPAGVNPRRHPRSSGSPCGRRTRRRTSRVCRRRSDSPRLPRAAGGRHRDVVGTGVRAADVRTRTRSACPRADHEPPAAFVLDGITQRDVPPPSTS